jgi:hypothetical protein
MITCFLRYEIGPAKIREFERYGRLALRKASATEGVGSLWSSGSEADIMGISCPPESAKMCVGPYSPALKIETERDDPHLTSPWWGGSDFHPCAGGRRPMSNFPSLSEYEAYCQKAADDPECQAAIAYAKETGCIRRWERAFFRPRFRVTIRPQLKLGHSQMV